MLVMIGYRGAATQEDKLNPIPKKIRSLTRPIGYGFPENADPKEAPGTYDLGGMDMAQAQQRGRPRNDPGQPWSPRSLLLRRTDADLTMRQLGDRTGISPTTLCLLESGERLPTQEMIGLLAKALGCSPRDLGRDPRL